MLIYDHNKKILGIDDDDLRLLGFTTAEQLTSSCSDIADFFIKKPGYIHNFKNFQWIDFVLHSDAENAKALVNTGTKSFACEIIIKPFHLLDTPQADGFAIYLQHVKPLAASEAAELGTTAAPVSEAPAPEAPVMPSVAAEPEVPAFEVPQPEPVQEELPSFEDVTPTTLNEPESVEIPEEDYIHDPYDIPEQLHADFSKPLEIEDDIFMQEEEATGAAPVTPDFEETPLEMPEAPAMEPAEERVERPMLGDYLTPQEQEYAAQMKDFKDYVYDPHIAADELGLPVDLIEEFIGDFINQAHEFHDELFEAATKADFDNVKLLSHKLKGVAANLRIEDAFEMLAVINSSHEQAEVEAYLKMFYMTIAKLEGKEIPEFETAAAAPSEPEAETAPVIPEPMPEVTEEEDLSVATQPDTGDDDMYALDIKEVAPDTEPSEPVVPAAADDDIYAFDIAPEPEPVPEVTPDTESATASEPSSEEDLYSFEPELPPMDDSLLQESDAAAFEPETTRASEPAAAAPDEDLYGFEPELPPLDESFESAGTSEEPFGTTELPPFEEAATASPAGVEPMHYDTASAANELGLPQDVVEELVNDFIEHARSIRTSVDAAVDSGEQQVWQSQANQMKGIADNLRMNEIATDLNQLESATDPAAAQEALQRLYGHIEQL